VPLYAVDRPQQEGWDTVRLLFPPMVHARRGDLPETRAWFDKAVSRTDRDSLNDPELIRFRDDAEKLA
jgi:hypothetical protein